MYAFLIKILTKVQFCFPIIYLINPISPLDFYMNIPVITDKLLCHF